MANVTSALTRDAWRDYWLAIANNAGEPVQTEWLAELLYAEYCDGNDSVQGGEWTGRNPDSADSEIARSGSQLRSYRIPTTPDNKAAFFLPGILGAGGPAVLAHMTQLPIPLLIPKEAGAYLRIHEKTVNRMARQRRLPALKIGKHWRFRQCDLDSWIADNVASASQPGE